MLEPESGVSFHAFSQLMILDDTKAAAGQLVHNTEHRGAIVTFCNTH